MGAAPQLAEDLFNEHHRRIYLYCLRQLGSPEEAEDAVQATYLNACRSLNDGFEPEAAQAWLYKVAHNVCLTRQRSSYRRARVERPEDLQAVQDVVAAPEVPGDELFGLDEALAGLPEQQRQAILLREWQGLSYREVATTLGITQPAVETLIFRARRSLASALERPARHRRRLVHSLNAGPLLASLKAALAGNVAASVATAVAVAASATVLTAASSTSTRDFPPRVAPPVKVEQAKPTASRAILADRSADEALFPPTASPSPHGHHPKKWAGTHPRANGKDKPKHANNGNKGAQQGDAGSNGNPPSAPPGQARPSENGASAPALGKSSKRG